jgi:hypothetical protein
MKKVWWITVKQAAYAALALGGAVFYGLVGGNCGPMPNTWLARFLAIGIAISALSLYGQAAVEREKEKDKP